jgi:hypothetical protein
VKLQRCRHGGFSSGGIVVVVGDGVVGVGVGGGWE